MEEVTKEKNQYEIKEITAGRANLLVQVVQTPTKLDCATKRNFSKANSMDIDEEVTG